MFNNAVLVIPQLIIFPHCGNLTAKLTNNDSDLHMVRVRLPYAQFFWDNHDFGEPCTGLIQLGPNTGSKSVFGHSQGEERWGVRSGRDRAGIFWLHTTKRHVSAGKCPSQDHILPLLPGCQFFWLVAGAPKEDILPGPIPGSHSPPTSIPVTTLCLPSPLQNASNCLLSAPSELH